jgi:hypothetical protein
MGVGVFLHFCEEKDGVIIINVFIDFTALKD